MPIIAFNVSWMLYNSFLAFLALLFGYIFLRAQTKVLRLLFGFLWLIFLPNTIYVFTDLEHLIYQWPHLAGSLRIILVLQYLLLQIVGLMTFVFSFYPFEHLITVFSLQKRKDLAIIVFNFFIAFGMVLGRVERINSWQIFTNPTKVLHSALTVLVSFDLLGLTILFGLLCNFIYFLFRGYVLRLMKKIK